MLEKVTSNEEKSKKKGPVLIKSEKSGKTPAKTKLAGKSVQPLDIRTEISQEAWNRMVADAAYFIAENRGFGARCCDEDWYEAERLMDRHLAARH